MTASEAFKVGFMSRCIDSGLTSAAQMLDALEKSALSFPGEKALTDLAGTGLSWAIPALVAGPPILGYAAGRIAGKATDIDETDEEDVKQQELIAEYRRQAAIIRNRARMRGQ